MKQNKEKNSEYIFDNEWTINIYKENYLCLYLGLQQFCTHPKYYPQSITTECRYSNCPLKVIE
jgi:hypothetical protein